MDSREVSEWIAYWSLEPPPDPYGHAALICSVIASVMGTKQYKPSDFDPRPDLSSQDQDQSAIVAQISAFAAAFNSRLEG